MTKYKNSIRMLPEGSRVLLKVGMRTKMTRNLTRAKIPLMTTAIQEMKKIGICKGL